MDNVRILIKRVLNGDKGPSFSDGHNVRLLFEGGGTAPGGAAAAVALQDALVFAHLLKQNDGNFDAAKEQLIAYQKRSLEGETDPDAINLMDYVDGASGSSAGIVTMAYLRAGQAHKGITIFTDYLTDKRFMDKTRLVKYAFKAAANEVLGLGRELDAKPVMDMGFLEDILRGKHDPSLALNTDDILDSRTPLEVMVMDVDGMRVRGVDKFNDKDAFIKTLIAGCTVPGIAGGAVPTPDGRFTDAGRCGDNTPHITDPETALQRAIIFTSCREGDSPSAASFADRAMDGFVMLCARLMGPEGAKIIPFALERREKEAKAVLESRKNKLHTHMGPPADVPEISYSCQNAEEMRTSMTMTYGHISDLALKAIAAESGYTIPEGFKLPTPLSILGGDSAKACADAAKRPGIVARITSAARSRLGRE